MFRHTVLNGNNFTAANIRTKPDYNITIYQLYRALCQQAEFEASKKY